MSGGVDADLLSIFAQSLKGNDSVNLGKYSVVSSDSHIISGVYLGASLANKDISGCHLLATILLYPAPLPCAVSPVPGTSACLLM